MTSFWSNVRDVLRVPSPENWDLAALDFPSASSPPLDAKPIEGKTRLIQTRTAQKHRDICPAKRARSASKSIPG
eukprot:12882828-Prorocentrum_lima.AAC.1